MPDIYASVTLALHESHCVQQESCSVRRESPCTGNVSQGGNLLLSGIVASLENIKAHPSVVGFMKRAMPQWRSELRLEGELYDHCKINHGVFQGDSLSPLQFILIIVFLKPLTSILNNTRKGYKLDSGNVMNHLLHMDDSKLYGMNDK